MFAFQTEKYRRINAGEAPGPYERGFIETGFWGWSRHPNYFCEVTLWWCFYLFSVAATGDVLNWTFVGPLFLSGLFVLPRASLDVTETLSSRKYKAYPEYQRRVSRFIPWPPQGIADTLADRLLVGWFVVGFCITYLIDMEQVVVQDPAKYGLPGHTPWWPPAPCVRAIHWWGHTADRLVLARPVWFQAGIWLEIVVQAPFYALAIFAFVQRRSWIRIPAIIYSTVLLTIMPMVMAEQYFGEHRTDQPGIVTAVYGAYVVMPLLVLLRVRNADVFPVKAKQA